MGLFDLPENWVYIHYKDGTKKNVANTDTLYPCEVDRFKKEWEQDGPIEKITLETSDGRVLAEYKF